MIYESAQYAEAFKISSELEVIVRGVDDVATLTTSPDTVQPKPHSAHESSASKLPRACWHMTLNAIGGSGKSTVFGISAFFGKIARVQNFLKSPIYIKNINPMPIAKGTRKPKLLATSPPVPTCEQYKYEPDSVSPISPGAGTPLFPIFSWAQL